jgi:anti-sigma factor RsiW
MKAELNSLCEHLDAFLDGDLSASERGVFEAHLPQCSACCEAVDQQRWIDELLASDAAAELEASPPMVMSMRRRRWLVAAAAAGLAALAAWPLVPLPRREGIGERRLTPPSVAGPEHLATVENSSTSPSLPGGEVLRPRLPVPAARSRFPSPKWMHKSPS